jgi:hypothetical protein
MAIPSQSDAIAAAALDAELRRRAARQAAAAGGAAPPVEKVRVQVTRLGADKISMGMHIAGIGEAFYEKDEEFDADKPIADGLEVRGFVVIKGAATGEPSTVELAMQQAAGAALEAEEAKAAERKAAEEKVAADATAEADKAKPKP